MTEYTPTAEQVKIMFVGKPEGFYGPHESRRAEEFDRWLAAYTAKVQEDALREAADHKITNPLVFPAVWGYELPEDVRETLHARADSLHPVIPSAAGDEIEEGR